MCHILLMQCSTNIEMIDGAYEMNCKNFYPRAVVNEVEFAWL